MIYCGILLLILFNIIKIKFYTIVNVKLFLNFILNLNTWFMYKSKIILILISYNNYTIIYFTHMKCKIKFQNFGFRRQNPAPAEATASVCGGGSNDSMHRLEPPVDQARPLE